MLSIPQNAPNDFHHRCKLAVSHPVTLGAVALLLLNDWLLKPVWQSDWTTGQLSNFAWMVFAPPVLLFALSLLARANPGAQRAAWFAAYLGLPLLYAASQRERAIVHHECRQST